MQNVLLCKLMRFYLSLSTQTERVSNQWRLWWIKDGRYKSRIHELRRDLDLDTSRQEQRRHLPRTKTVAITTTNSVTGDVQTDSKRLQPDNAPTAL